MTTEHHADNESKPAADSPESAAGFSMPSSQTKRVKTGTKLASPRLNIVLVEPEIPNNTGNIGRTCVTTGCRLHLVKPLGFDIDEKACRRAGLDYWPRLDLEEHDSLDDYLQRHPPNTELTENARPRTWFLTTKAKQTIFDAPIKQGDHLVFGRESAGLAESVHAAYPDQRLCVPMVANERSLNLSTCVAIVAYEAVRKMIGSGEAVVDSQGRLLSAD